MPTGYTKPLRALFDTGATDNFIHTKIIKDFNIKTSKLSKKEKVTLGSEGASANVTKETTPVTTLVGKYCKHKTKFTVINLEDYDIVLGRPFQKYVKASIEGDDVIIPTSFGKQTLPKWVDLKTKDIKIFKVNGNEFHHELKSSKQCFILHPQSIDKESENFDKEITLSNSSELSEEEQETLQTFIDKNLKDLDTTKKEPAWRSFLRMHIEHKNQKIENNSKNIKKTRKITKK